MGKTSCLRNVSHKCSNWLIDCLQLVMKLHSSGCKKHNEKCQKQEILTTTRMPSNLRLTIGKCMHLVTHGHFWSRDKDGGHTIRSAEVENPMLHIYRTGVIEDRSFTLRE